MTELVPLADAALINPRPNKPLAGDDIVSFLSMADVETDGTTTGGIDRLFADVSKGFTQFEKGDVLVAKITPCFENGKIAQAITHRSRAAGSTEFHVVRPRPGILDSRYLHHFLRQPSIRVEGERRMTGSAGQRRVPRSYLAGLRILLPPIEEQKRIADTLDRADGLLATRRHALPLLNELAQSVFLDMFGDIHNDDMAVLGNYLTFVTSGGRGWAKYYSDSGARFIRSLDVRMNEIEDRSAVYVNPPNNAEARRTRVHSGDVLLTITGSLIGRVAPVSPDLEGSYVSQHVAILRPEASRLDSGFLSFFLSIPSKGQRQIARLQYGQTKPGLNFEQIRKMRIPLPDISQQRLFTERLLAVRRIAESNRAHLEGLKQLADSIQHRAFRGEL